MTYQCCIMYITATHSACQFEDLEMSNAAKVELTPIPELDPTQANDGDEEIKVKKVAVPAKIIRGRMPLPLVWNIRFVALLAKDANDSSVAKDFFTTAGKVMDVRLNKNFRYITAETTFGQSDIDEASTQLIKNVNEGKIRNADGPSGDYNIDDAKSLFDLLDTMVSGFSSVQADRDAYNVANPRVNKKKEKPSDDEDLEDVQLDEAAIMDVAGDEIDENVFN